MEKGMLWLATVWTGFAVIAAVHKFDTAQSKMPPESVNSSYEESVAAPRAPINSVGPRQPALVRKDFG